MAKRSLRQRMQRATIAVLMGGSTLVLGDCDPAVRQTLLTGLEATTSTLSQTFITAFFLSLQEDEDLTMTSSP